MQWKNFSKLLSIVRTSRFLKREKKSFYFLCSGFAPEIHRKMVECLLSYYNLHSWIRLKILACFDPKGIVYSQNWNLLKIFFSNCPDCPNSPYCLFLTPNILVATHEKTFQNKQKIFPFTSKSFCLLQLKSLVCKRKKNSWLFASNISNILMLEIRFQDWKSIL